MPRLLSCPHANCHAPSLRAARWRAVVLACAVPVVGRAAKRRRRHQGAAGTRRSVHPPCRPAPTGSQRWRTAMVTTAPTAPLRRCPCEAMWCPGRCWTDPTKKTSRPTPCCLCSTRSSRACTRRNRASGLHGCPWIINPHRSTFAHLVPLTCSFAFLAGLRAWSKSSQDPHLLIR